MATSRSDGEVTITSSDGEVFVVEEELKSMSQLIRNMIEDVHDCTNIPLPKDCPKNKITGKILAMVIAYCRKYANTPMTDDRTADQDGLSLWQRFILASFGQLDLLRMFDKCGVKDDPDVLKDVKKKAWENANKNNPSWEEDIHDLDDEPSSRDWYTDFVELDQADMAYLFGAASYLGIQSLMNLASFAVAYREIENRSSPEEVARASTSRMTTPEEEDEVRRENQ